MMKRPVLTAGFARGGFDTYVDRGVGLVQANTLNGNAEWGRIADGRTLPRKKAKSCHGTSSAIHGVRLLYLQKHWRG